MVLKVVGIVLGVVMFSGCYTQFSTLTEKREAPPPQISYEIDSASGDTVKVVRSVDTVVGTQGTQQQNCYWTRNFLGEPELRCDNSMYGHDWYVYNDYPWWYRSDPYYYDSYGRCPRYYYYDVGCGCCQYWGGGGFRDYNYNRSGGRGNSISGSGGNGRTRQTSSSTVPSKQNVRQQQGVQKVGSDAAVLNRQRQAQAKNAVNEAVKGSAPAKVYQEPQIENQSRPEPAAIPREQSQPSAPAAAPASNPPSGNSNPPSNSGGGSGDNGNRRNPRSW